MNVLLQTLWTWVSTSEGFILEQGCSAKPLSLASSRWLKQEPADPLPTRPGPACRVQLLSQECFSLFSFFFFFTVLGPRCVLPCTGSLLRSAGLVSLWHVGS